MSVSFLARSFSELLQSSCSPMWPWSQYQVTIATGLHFYSYSLCFFIVLFKHLAALLSSYVSMCGNTSIANYHEMSHLRLIIQQVCRQFKLSSQSKPHWGITIDWLKIRVLPGGSLKLISFTYLIVFVDSTHSTFYDFCTKKERLNSSKSPFTLHWNS